MLSLAQTIAGAPITRTTVAHRGRDISTYIIVARQSNTDPTIAMADPVSAHLPQEPQRIRGMQCSDCKNVSRTYYYALNERPVCTKCKQQYGERIARATAPGAWGRTVIHGVNAASIGALITALGITIFGFTRILCAVGVGYFVGSAIKKANGGWPGRKYQILAVALTYFALGFGAIIPTVWSLRSARRDYRQAVADSVAAARAKAAADSASASDSTRPSASSVDQLAAIADSMEAARSRRPVHKSAAEQGADKLARGSLFGVVTSLLVMILTLPILANLQYGIYAAGLGLMAFAFGMKKAWDLTEGGMVLELKGPYKVGEGPIAPSFQA